ncbi:hypothetical protein K2Q16_00585 [Patescibacteria group bacterium]|nr:hypothetical protein [Patescibacteria group bacterium]
MEFFRKKKYTLVSLVFSALLLSLYLLLMTSLNSRLTLELIIGVVKPLGVASVGGIVFALLFLFFHESIFKSWLKHVAWWYGLGLFFVTITTPVYSSNILSLDRSQVVFGGVVLLALITVPYILLRRHKISVAFES